MTKFIVELKNTTTWEIEVEANDPWEAMEMTVDLGRDELDERKITDNCWDVEAWETND